MKDSIAVYVADLGFQDKLFQKLDEIEQIYDRDTKKVRLEEQVVM